MNIVLLSADFPPNVGGVAAHVAELGSALAALGHHVVVVARSAAGLPDECIWRGMQVLRPRLAHIKPLYTAQLRSWLKRYLVRHPADLVHVHGLRPLEATARLELPVLFTNHTSGFLQRVERGARARARVGARLRHLGHVIAPSQELVDATYAVGYRGAVTFISNGVDVQRFAPAPDNEARQAMRKALGLEAGHSAVLLARRLVEKNGVRYFAQSTEWLGSGAARLVIAGDGPEREAMSAILEGTGWLARTIFLGAVDNTRMPALYQACDLSVLPSLQEATSITGLESMASGLALVGTDVGGIPAIIDDGHTGRLVPARNPRALGEAIAELIDDPSTRTAFGQAGRAAAVARFAWPQIARATVDIYAEVVR